MIFLTEFNKQSRQSRSLILLALLLASGCTSLPDTIDLADRDAVNLSATPFFPQQDYQCGPAALATLLTASGVPVTPQELLPKVYLPERRGSLQIEMIAATRGYGRLPYLLQPRLDHLLDELDAGRPVLVLQNLGFEIKPLWHYAVVTGYDPEGGSILLRSGTHARKRLSIAKFMRTWKRADFWAFVALRPDELPANIDRTRLLNAAVAMETAKDAELSISLYQNLSQHFPDESIVWLGLANMYQQTDHYMAAINAYRHALAIKPDNVAASNNLALALSHAGCHAEATQLAQKTVQLAHGTNQFLAESKRTLAEVSATASRQQNNNSIECKIP